MSEQSPGQNSDRRFHEDLTRGGLRFKRPPALGQQPFRPLPRPTGPSPFRLSLEEVLPPERMQAINASGRVLFHMVGDTGGVKAPQPQQITAMHMDKDFEVADPAARPYFFYHLGDVVYYYGEASEYYPQFYGPYVHYPAPIFAIPGNHDGDVSPGATTPSLDAFARNFCAPRPEITPEAGDVPRDAMTQPNVYWTLEAPFVTIVGLYTNVPEGGQLDDQAAWFTSELRDAPQDKALLVAMHHPIYSADGHHSGSQYMGEVLDRAIEDTGRTPDAVFAAHVHNYQRFTRRRDEGHEVPYVVAGAGGYWHLHYVEKHLGLKVQTPFTTEDPEVTLESYCDDRHGYLRLEVDAKTLKGVYFAVPRPQESWDSPAQQVDAFTLDLSGHRLIR